VSDRGRFLALLERMLVPGGLLYLTLPRSCLTPKPQQQQQQKSQREWSRAAPAFGFARFEALLCGDLGLALQPPPDSRDVTPSQPNGGVSGGAQQPQQQAGKVAFYCLQKPAAARALKARSESGGSEGKKRNKESGGGGGGGGEEEPASPFAFSVALP